MKEKIRFSATPEWVLGTMSKNIYLSKTGTVKILADRGQKNNFIKKALDALEIPYKVTRLYPDDELSYICNYQFKMDDIENECPIIYQVCREAREFYRLNLVVPVNGWLKVRPPDVDLYLNTERIFLNKYSS